MIKLYAPRVMTSPEPRELVYAGVGMDLNEEILDGFLSKLKIVKVLFPDINGSVVRDKKDTTSWLIWLVSQQKKRFNEEVNPVCRFDVSLFSSGKGVLRIAFNIRPESGSGRISYSSFIYRIGDDDYICLE